MKKLYKGTFNYSGEEIELYTHSTSPECAFLNFVNQISKKLHVGKRTVLNKFDGSKDNYYIKEVKTMKEKEKMYINPETGFVITESNLRYIQEEQRKLKEKGRR